MKLVIYVALALLAAGGVVSGRSAQAQDYPSKPIRIVIPFAPGGGTDIIMRSLIPKMRDALGGQTIIVENKPGAGTIIGTETVARAAPDGYTLLATVDQTMTMNPYLYDNLPYQPARDFTPISLLSVSIGLYAANPSVPAKTLKEFVDHVKANPGKVNYGSGTVSARVYTQQLMDVTGTKMQYINYNGGAPALAALLNNEVQLVIGDIPTFGGAVRDGRLVGLATGGPKRSGQLSNVPTLREAGFPELEYFAAWGMWAPAGTPPAIVKKLSDAVAFAIQEKETRERITSVGAEPASSTPEELGAIVNKNAARWGDVIKKAGIKAAN